MPLNAVLALVRKNRTAVTFLSLPLIYVAFRKGWLKVRHLAILVLLYFVARAQRQRSKAKITLGEGASAEINSFEDAKAFVSCCGGALTNEQKLNIYGLFKQATAGDCKSERPGGLDLAAQYKWDAHKSRAGMASDAAQAEYVKVCQELQQVVLGGKGVKEGGAAKGGGGGTGMEQAQSVMSNVEGAAEEGAKDFAVLVNDENYEELEASLPVASRASVDEQNEDGETALHIACDRGFDRAVKLLLDHGATPTVTSADGTTPLHMLMCASAESVGSIDLLLAAKANVNAADEDGNTALHSAVLNEEKAFVSRLLDAKADVNLRNTAGETARETNEKWFDETMAAASSSAQ